MGYKHLESISFYRTWGKKQAFWKPKGALKSEEYGRTAVFEKKVEKSFLRCVFPLCYNAFFDFVPVLCATYYWFLLFERKSWNMQSSQTTVARKQLKLVKLDFELSEIESFLSSFSVTIKLFSCLCHVTKNSYFRNWRVINQFCE